ncbi:MAG: hypothetical protein U0325_10800 [Polyangiales bacterium]
MIPRQMDAAVLYDSPHVPPRRRVAVALLFGALPPAVGAWWRWVRHRGEGPSTLHLALGLAVAVAMIAAALRSRTAYRVEITPDSLRVHRDPGVVEAFALGEVTVRAEPVVGGWSRTPAERLAITTRDGHTSRFALPDDAHTPGIVDDIVRVQGGMDLASLFDERSNDP